MLWQYRKYSIQKIINTITSKALKLIMFMLSNSLLLISIEEELKTLKSKEASLNFLLPFEDLLQSDGYKLINKTFNVCNFMILNFFVCSMTLFY